MKNLFLIFCAFCATSLILSSCDNKPDRMTDAEKQAQIDSIYEAKATLVREEMIRQCTDEMPMRVQQKVDSIVNAKMMADSAGNMASNDQDAMRDNTISSESGNKDEMAKADDHDDHAMEGDKKEMTDEEEINMKVEEKIADLREEMNRDCNQRVMAMANHNADSVIQMRIEANAATPGAKKSTKTSTPETPKTTNSKGDKMSGQSNTQEKKEKMSGEKNTDAKKKKMGGGN